MVHFKIQVEMNARPLKLFKLVKVWEYGTVFLLLVTRGCWFLMISTKTLDSVCHEFELITKTHNLDFKANDSKRKMIICLVFMVWVWLNADFRSLFSGWNYKFECEPYLCHDQHKKMQNILNDPINHSWRQDLQQKISPVSQFVWESCCE